MWNNWSTFSKSPTLQTGFRLAQNILPDSVSITLSIFKNIFSIYKKQSFPLPFVINLPPPDSNVKIKFGFFFFSIGRLLNLSFYCMELVHHTWFWMFLFLRLINFDRSGESFVFENWENIPKARNSLPLKVSVNKYFYIWSFYAITGIPFNNKENYQKFMQVVRKTETNKHNKYLVKYYKMFYQTFFIFIWFYSATCISFC